MTDAEARLQSELTSEAAGLSPSLDLAPARIEEALAEIDPVFLGTPQFVDEVVLVDDDRLRTAQELIADALGLLVEPAGAAGVAALLEHGASLTGQRVAVILTGAAA